MTNRAWLLNKMQNMSDEELVKFDVGYFICKEIKSLDCKGGFCVNCKSAWLKSEHKEKITLSEAERAILKNMKGEEWITREKCGRLCVYHLEKPYKDNECEYWKGQACAEIGFFDHLFQFIKWEDSEPYNIAELLKGE